MWFRKRKLQKFIKARKLFPTPQYTMLLGRGAAFKTWGVEGGVSSCEMCALEGAYGTTGSSSLLLQYWWRQASLCSHILFTVTVRPSAGQTSRTAREHKPSVFTLIDWGICYSNGKLTNTHSYVLMQFSLHRFLPRYLIMEWTLKWFTVTQSL